MDLADALLLARERGWVRALWWKLTAAALNAYDVGPERAWVAMALEPRGVRVFDTLALTSGDDSPFAVAARLGTVAATWDNNAHFRPFVYRGLNEALLAAVCGASGSTRVSA